MKYIFTAMLLMAAYLTKGQIINFPDSNFKYWLLRNNTIDLNNDGEIQVNEAFAVNGVSISNDVNDNHPVHDITGIGLFRNLKIFNSGFNRIENMNLSGLDSLQEFNSYGDTITNLNLAGCNNLKFFNSNYVDWTNNLEFSGFPSLKKIEVNYSNATGVILQSCPNLQSVFATHNRIPNLSIQNCETLQTIGWLNSRSTELRLSSLPNLQGLYCDGNLLTDLNLPILPNLVTLSCPFNLIRRLDLQDFPNLSRIDCSMSDSLRMIHLENLHRLTNLSLTSSNGTLDSLYLRNCDSVNRIESTRDHINYLNLSGCDNLKSIEFEYFDGVELDFSNCINLEVIHIGQAGNLSHVNFKNGKANTWYPGITPNLRYLCADDNEFFAILNNLVNAGNTNITVNSYCSFIPGGSYNTIKGIVRVDKDNNGCDSSDRGLQNVTIKLTDTTNQTYVTSSNMDGIFKAYTYKGAFTITPYFPYPYFSVNPTTITANFDTANGLTNTANFCILPIGIHNDLEVTFLPTWPAARPGFYAGYTLVYKNRGTTTLSGNVSVNFDNSKMIFVSASENVTTQSTGQLIWNYNNLQPFETKSINVTFNLLPPPINNIDDTITYLAAITPSVNDETAFDNSFVLPQRVIGSFDPNDKQCLEGSKLDISKLGDYLHYQIHFQNEGTDTAFNVVVADTLSDKLDWNTFEFVSSSHDCNPTLKNEKIEFIFENIHLPYKAINEPASNGWVAFKIKPKPSVVIGDSLNNKAAIYFDFNKPVITNTATTIVSSSATPVPVKLEYFSVNQKNNTNVLNWKASCSYGNTVFIIERSIDGIHFNSIGNITATALRCQLPFNFTDNNPVAGKNYYRLKIMDADGISFYSKILVIGNGKAGLQITATTNNSIYLNSNKQQTIQLKVIAADGREIWNEKQTVAAGNNSINLQMKNAANGIYTLIVYTTEGDVTTTRFIK